MDSGPPSSIAFVVHKPVGVISSRVDSRPSTVITKKSDPLRGQAYGGEARPTVFDIAGAAGFPVDYSLVGRLDAETSGIMLFTNNIKLDRAIRDPPPVDAMETDIKVKEYAMVVMGPRLFPGRYLDLLALTCELSQPFTFSRHGVIYSTQKATVNVLRHWQETHLSRGRNNLGWCVELSVVIREGKHHQLRRMARRSKLTVLSLRRVRIAGLLCIDSIPEPGDCRWLEREEVEQLFAKMDNANRLV